MESERSVRDIQNDISALLAEYVNLRFSALDDLVLVNVAWVISLENTYIPVDGTSPAYNTAYFGDPLSSPAHMAGMVRLTSEYISDEIRNPSEDYE